MEIEKYDQLIQEEYKKNKNIRKEDIEQIKNWLEKEPSLPELNDLFLIQFYTSVDYSIQKTKALINYHYSLRNDAPELFTGRSYGPPKFDITFWDGSYMFECSPYLTDEGYRVLYWGLRDSNPALYNFEQEAVGIVKSMIGFILEKGSCAGYYVVVDMAGFGVGHFQTVSFPILKNFLNFTQNAVPFKMRGIHFINGNSVLELILNMIRPFMNKEILEMITIETGSKKLLSALPNKMIPQDLGGTRSETRQQLTDIFKDLIDANEKAIAVELLLKSSNCAGSYKARHAGIVHQGSFKKLELD